MANRAMVGRRWTAEQARTVLDGWEESGQSCAAYARAIGVVPQRLSWWRRRLVDGGTRTVVKSTLVPVTVRGAAAIVGSAPVVVTTRAGARIEVNEIDAATAAWVVGVLVGEERS